MKEDLFRPFGENFSATAKNFEMSESYRWVRLGVGLLITGYALLVPLLIYWLFFSENAKGVPDFILLAALVTIFAALSLIVTGSILLRFAPHQDEKTAANKYLIAYGIAIGCGSFILVRLGTTGLSSADRRRLRQLLPSRFFPDTG
jgi:hypothetical protein